MRSRNRAPRRAMARAERSPAGRCGQWRYPPARDTARGMPRADACDLSDADWRRLLVRDPDAACVSELYGPLIATRDCVLGRIVQTLDGRIATAGGTSFWIGGK